MVAELVRDHVCPREVARRAQPRLHVAVERQIDVGPAIGWAVEGPHLAAGGPAARPHPLPEKHELGALVGVPLAGEDVLPRVLRAGEDVGAEVAQVALRILGGIDRSGLWGLDAVVERRVDGEPPAATPATEHLEGDHHEDPEQSDSATHPPTATRGDR